MDQNYKMQHLKKYLKNSLYLTYLNRNAMYTKCKAFLFSLTFPYSFHILDARKKEKFMESKKIIIVISIVFVIILVGVAYFIGTNRSETDIPEPPVSDTDKDSDEQSSTKPSKKDIVQGKKFVTMDTDSYISFPSKGTFTKYSVKNDGSHSTDSGKYKINNKRVTLDTLKKDAYYREDYILLKDGLYHDDIYTMYYESTKNEDFVKSLSDVLLDYIKNSVEDNEDLKKVLDKIEVDTIKYCYKGTPDEDEFSCSVDYRVYLKNYDYKNEDEYEDLFAGSSPTFKKDYVLRWSSFSFKPSGEEYKVTGSGTGL